MKNYKVMQTCPKMNENDEKKRGVEKDVHQKLCQGSGRENELQEGIGLTGSR